MAKAGRKRIKIDWKKVGKAIESGASGVQCAAMLAISYATLTRACLRDNKVKFDEYYQQKKQAGNVAIFGKQYDQAMAGNTSMLIWLGKNRLDQTDKRENVNQNDGKIEIEITYPDGE